MWNHKKKSDEIDLLGFAVIVQAPSMPLLPPLREHGHAAVAVLWKNGVARHIVSKKKNKKPGIRL